jgi:hypothetical protein
MQRIPTLNAGHYRAISALASKVALGDYPRKVLVDRGFLQKRKNRRGVMAYPPHPNGRDIMDKTQLSIVKGAEDIFSRLLAKHNNEYDSAFTEYQDSCAKMFDACSILHETCLPEPTLLEDVRERQSNALTCE